MTNIQVIILIAVVLVAALVIVGFLVTTRRRKAKGSQAPIDETTAVVPEPTPARVDPRDQGLSAPEPLAPTTSEPEAQQVTPRQQPQQVAPPEPQPQQVVPPDAKKDKRLSRLGQGLLKTRGLIGDKVAILSRHDRLSEDDFDEVEEVLIRADLGVKAATIVVDRLRDGKVRGADLEQSLKDALITILKKGEATLSLEGPKPRVLLITGVNGVGKTTSIAKLAHLLKNEGRTVVLAAADTFRAAAIDQLGTWASRVGIHMVKHEPGSDPGAVVFDAIQHAKAKNIDVVIVDTAGRLHTKTNLMEELKKVWRIADREAGGVAETLLVIDATVGQNGISQARVFGDAVDVTGVILTKLDGTARGGIVVAIQEELGIPVKAIGVGETLEDLEPFEPRRFAEALLEPEA
ncbi:MAG: signal recognition particle-docking protein FtsY [Actinomycetota bacterium]|nr:signal recognition particle-docking protein FtsY [Actinomycetota bacterium]